MNQQQLQSSTFLTPTLRFSKLLYNQYCIVSPQKQRFWSPKIFMLMNDNYVTCNTIFWRRWYLYKDSIIKKEIKKKKLGNFYFCSLPYVSVFCLLLQHMQENFVFTEPMSAHTNTYFTGSEK